MNGHIPPSDSVKPPGPVCPSCKQPVPAGSPAGLCPRCLLAGGAQTLSGGPGPRFEPPSVEAVAALFPALEIIGLLGAGGMGAVYKARQPALDRLVALKLLPKGGTDGANLSERFNREARALARLSHPNIVAVHEFGQAGGLYFFIMEFVDGTNLRRLEQAGRLPPREALQIIPQICDALQYAHDEGVVHRDIKPENVLVDRRGRVKIADFGLAKILGVDPDALRLTADGQVMGTPHYMAPEQIERPLTVDHRADIYSLGVVFYEMLTGDLPIGRFPPPSRKVAVDVRLDEVVLRALENDPQRRYQQAGEVKTRLSSIQETPTEATPEATPSATTSGARGGHFPRWTQRRHHLILAGLIGLVGLVTGSFFLKTTVLDARLRGGLSRAATEIRAERDPATGRPTARIPGGGIVEVVAISDAGAAPNAWWTPDGRPLTNAALRPGAIGTITHDAPVTLKDFVVRFQDLPDGASGPHLDFGPGVSWTGGGEVFDGGHPLPGAWPVRAALPPGLKRMSLRVGFDLDPWRVVATYDAQDQNSTQIRHPGDPTWQSFVHRASDHSGSAQVTLILGTRNPNWRTRVVAVTTNGVAHDFTSGNGTPSESSEVWTFSFADVPLTTVKAFEVQVRPVTWFVFRDLALVPSSPLPAPEPLSFSETIERTFDELIDFETGRTGTFPPSKPGDNPFAGIGENILWAQENGFDAAAGVGELQVLDMTFAAVPDSEWDTLAPQDVADRHARGTFRPRTLSPVSGGHGFRTFVYRTREGGSGILRFRQIEEGRSEITLQFKRVETGHWNPTPATLPKVSRSP
ncbi:MAG: serine/threonine protein kinase [Verrucomicrobiae bacterium]|nr:serine/threonine protein kinase [Verrucomicrobiae bacterium]